MSLAFVREMAEYARALAAGETDVDALKLRAIARLLEADLDLLAVTEEHVRAIVDRDRDADDA